MAEQEVPQLNTFAWNELMTGDASGCRDFYTSLLGWTFEEMDMEQGGTYTMFKSGDREVGGMMQMGPEMVGVPPHWMGYIAVDDVDAKATRVTELGGQILVPPTDIPNVGRFAVLQDPSGAAISIITFIQR